MSVPGQAPPTVEDLQRQLDELRAEYERRMTEFVDAIELRIADNVHRFETRLAQIDNRVGEIRREL